MKAKVWAEWAGEVEVDIHPEEVAGYLGVQEAGEGWLHFLNRCASGLEKVPDEAIAQMSVGARKIVRDWYLKQAERYAEPEEGR